MAIAATAMCEFAGSMAMGSEAEFARAKAWLAVLLQPRAGGEAATNHSDMPDDSGAPCCGELFRFRYAAQDSQAFLASWRREASSKPLDERRVEHRVCWRDPAGRLTIRLECVEYLDFPAIEYVMFARNDGPDDSDVLEDFFPLNATWPAREQTSVLHRSQGSHAGQSDFLYEPVRLSTSQAWHSMVAGQGRSSNDNMPFWNLQTGGRGVMVALGWTGQWHTNIWFHNRTLHAEAHQETLRARLHPGEEIRTPRMLLMFWQDPSYLRGHNMLRRWIITHRTPRPNGKLLVAPYTHGSWGGQPTPKHLETLARLDGKTRHEYYWIDAGWYGNGQATDGIDGDWYVWAGSWNVNPTLHPDGFGPISDAVHAQGRKFLLWFDSERAYNDSTWYKQHPEFFLGAAQPRGNVLLNLGNPAARRFLTDFICGRIEENKIDCYRHDMNVDPLPFWKAADEPDRQGITENHYVQGLYAWWDEMLTRFPHLVIDNCCSGGRRLDLEMIGRSIQMTRSDFPCYPEALENWDEPAQTQIMGLAYWVPLQGTFVPCNGDTYMFRSNLGASLGFGTSGVLDGKAENGDLAAWASRMEEQYLRARPFFYGDYYPLTLNSGNPDIWAAMQFDRPDLGEGFVLAFRRPQNRQPQLTVSLGGLEASATYELEDVDTHETWRTTGQALRDGWTITMEKPHTSRLVFYRRVK